MAEQRGETSSEYVQHVLQPLLAAENAEGLHWFLCALNGPDHALLGTLCRKREWQVDQLLDVLIGNALTNLDAS
jgi:hypothetical protein